MSKITTSVSDIKYVSHMPGCRCAEYFGDDTRDDKALMVDDRRWEAPDEPHDYAGQALALGLAPALRNAAEAAGVPFLAMVEPRWNSAGERIGPRMETRVCEMVEYRLLLRSMMTQIGEVAERIKRSRR